MKHGLALAASALVLSTLVATTAFAEAPPTRRVAKKQPKTEAGDPVASRVPQAQVAVVTKRESARARRDQLQKRRNASITGGEGGR